MRDTKRGCNGMERFFLLGNTLHNCHPLGSRNTIYRVLWSWPPMLDNGRMTQVFHPQQVGAVPFDTVSQTGRGRGRTLVTENSTPRRFRHIAFSPDAVPRSARSWRVRPLAHLFSSCLPELRCQQALPVDRGFDLFGSPREPTRWMIRACHRKLSVLSYFSRQVDITRRNYVDDLLS